MARAAQPEANGAGSKTARLSRKAWHEMLVENAFSTLKRRFGEFVMASKPVYAFQEMLIKCFVYNLLIWYR